MADCGADEIKNLWKIVDDIKFPYIPTLTMTSWSVSVEKSLQVR
jgi:hypothetical protein